MNRSQRIEASEVNFEQTNFENNFSKLFIISKTIRSAIRIFGTNHTIIIKIDLIRNKQKYFED